MANPLQKLASWPAERRASFLAGLSGAELRQLELLTEGLFEFIPRMSPSLVAPRHLAPLVEALESAERQPRRVVVSTPPQHGKTETCLHALVRMLLRNPAGRHAYVSYASGRAQAMSVKARQIAEAAGLHVLGTQNIWRTHQGGGIVWTGVGAALTGFAVTGCLVVDDPLKNRVEAESQLYRERTDGWFKDVALTRCHPGASVVVIATRWHPDDLSGRLVGRGWERINLPAISLEGAALWPEQRPVSFLEGVRTDLGEYSFASLYQGEPRPRGGSVFSDPTLCEDVPKSGMRYAIGVDLAYTAKSQADYSVAIVLGRVPPTFDPLGRPIEDEKVGRFYIVDVIRKQVAAPAFKKELRQLARRYPGATMRWYAAGTEKGAADFMRTADLDGPGIALQVMAPRGDKFVRSQPFAASWNAGRVLVPRGASWADALVSELAEFTGNHDKHDDLIDAASAGFDVLATAGPGALKSPISILG